jgi:hypothetical protein
VAIKEDIEDIEMRDVTPEPIKTPQALPSQPKGKDDESKPTGDSSGIRDAGPTSEESDRRPIETSKDAKKRKSNLAVVQADTPEAQGEKSQEEIINECLLWVENCTDEEVQSENPWVMQELKKVKGTENQLRVLRPFNTRRQAAMLGAKSS